MNTASTREQIVAAADDLFYRQGFEHTSFAHIAAAVQISRGNFYHHFKSKDEILDAVIASRLARTEQMLAEWKAAGPTPAARIQCFIDMLIVNQPLIMAHGCPVGTLTTELAKTGHAAHGPACGLFTLFRTWLRQQFKLLGRTRDADELALHLLMRSQGVAVLAQALRDGSFVRREVAQMHEWLAAQTPGSPAKARPGGRTARSP